MENTRYSCAHRLPCRGLADDDRTGRLCPSLAVMVEVSTAERRWTAPPNQKEPNNFCVDSLLCHPSLCVETFHEDTGVHEARSLNVDTGVHAHRRDDDYTRKGNTTRASVPACHGVCQTFLPRATRTHQPHHKVITRYEGTHRLAVIPNTCTECCTR